METNSVSKILLLLLCDSWPLHQGQSWKFSPKNYYFIFILKIISLRSKLDKLMYMFWIPYCHEHCIPVGFLSVFIKIYLYHRYVVSNKTTRISLKQNQGELT